MVASAKQGSNWLTVTALIVGTLPLLLIGLSYLTNGDPMWIPLFLVACLTLSPIAVCLLIGMLFKERRLALNGVAVVLLAGNSYLLAIVVYGLYLGYKSIN